MCEYLSYFLSFCLQNRASDSEMKTGQKTNYKVHVPPAAHYVLVVKYTWIDKQMLEMRM